MFAIIWQLKHFPKVLSQKPRNWDKLDYIWSKMAKLFFLSTHNDLYFRSWLSFTVTLNTSFCLVNCVYTEMSHNCRLDLLLLFQHYHLWFSVQKWVILFHRFKLKQPSKTHTTFLLQTAHPQSLHWEFWMNSTHRDPYFGNLVIDCICSESHALSRWCKLTVKFATSTTNGNWNGRIYSLSHFEPVQWPTALL